MSGRRTRRGEGREIRKDKQRRKRNRESITEDERIPSRKKSKRNVN